MGTGFFGKLPAVGDFVARGLPVGVRTPLDGWLTNQIVPLARTATGWPEGGVRAAINLAHTPCLLLIEPSEDAVGRSYPIVACTPMAGADQTAADAWADTIWPMLLRGVDEGISPDALLTLCKAQSVSGAQSETIVPPVIWWAGQEPAAQAGQLARLAQISSD